MPYKRGQEWLRTVCRPSILGEGLLERARAISLALLGVTAAVGLSIVALAMNQGWPLVAGSSIPVISPQHHAVGRATVAAEMRSVDAGQAIPADRVPSPAGGNRSGDERQGSGVVGNPAPTASTELVVAPSSPAEPDGDAPHGSPKAEPTPVVQQPQQAAQAAPAPPTAEPAAAPVSQPPAETTPPGPTTAEAPVGDSDSDSDTPSWGHGKGHGYGHDDDWDDDDDDWDDDSHDWDDHGHGGWHGHHYGD
ncbi:MAG TPA: hypothetical protein VFM94_10455 [Solirubrobacterales bacterium]|nr:hypothetical protein [Solirubrobacterales bacterium]